MSLYSLPFSPEDLLVQSKPAQCDEAGATASADPLDKARCRNWELGEWYRAHVLRTDASAQALVDLIDFGRDERIQLLVTGGGLGVLAAATGLLVAGKI